MPVVAGVTTLMELANAWVLPLFLSTHVYPSSLRASLKLSTGSAQLRILLSNMCDLLYVLIFCGDIPGFMEYTYLRIYGIYILNAMCLYGV